MTAIVNGVTVMGTVDEIVQIIERTDLKKGKSSPWEITAEGGSIGFLGGQIPGARPLATPVNLCNAADPRPSCLGESKL